jgi:Putative beta barrel porin-7 (BBP7)
LEKLGVICGLQSVGPRDQNASSAREGAAVKRIIALFALLVTQMLVMGSIVDAQERSARVTNNRNRVPTRLVGARGGQPMHDASHVQLQPSDSIVQESVVGEPVAGDSIIASDAIEHEHSSSCGCGGTGCDSCSVGGELGYCDHCNAPNRFCICFPSHGWVHAEYLLWYQQGMTVPALATTSPIGTLRANAGIIGPNSTILYGNSNSILSDERSGGRIRFGWWLDRFPGLGIEGEYLGLAQGSETFSRTSAAGGTILARPFTNIVTGQADAELVSFPGVVGGTIGSETTSSLTGAAFRFRKQFCCSSGCGYSEFCCQTIPVSSRLDGTLGYRFWELKESIRIREQLTATNPAGTFDISDVFETRNQFNGGEVGFIWQGRRGWWTLDALMRVGIGNVNQTVTISGGTTRTQNGAAVLPNFNTGFLAGQNNIGTYDRNQFTMVPEFGLTAGYQLTRRLRATVGYSLIYWGNVVRPGDQIDTDVNPNLVQPQLAAANGALRPQFQFREADYWVQGLNFGGEFRW